MTVFIKRLVCNIPGMGQSARRDRKGEGSREVEYEVSSTETGKRALFLWY